MAFRSETSIDVRARLRRYIMSMPRNPLDTGRENVRVDKRKTMYRIPMNTNIELPKTKQILHPESFGSQSTTRGLSLAWTQAQDSKRFGHDI